MSESLQLRKSIEEKSIEIIIHSIENVIIKEDINVSFVVEHNGIKLGASNPMLIKSDVSEEFSVYRIDFIVNLPVPAKNKNELNTIVSVPLLIKALITSENEGDDYSSTTALSEVKKKSIYSAKSVPPPQLVLLGMCNLDLMPLVLGEEIFTEKLILETPTFTFDGSSVSWQNLPRLTVTASQSHSMLFDMEEAVNFLSITIESIHNLPQTFTDNFNYAAGTIAYIENETPERIIFEQGAWVKYRDVERTKRWNTLGHIESRAKLSPYKLDCDFKGVKNECEKQFDLAKKTCEDIPRIEWNSINRCIIWEAGIAAMKEHISKYKYWPFQFEIKDRVTAVKTKGGSSATQVYQCYVDVSELLFPGRRKCRILGQLQKYNSTDITEKVGLKENIFVVDTQRRETKERKNKSSRVGHSTVSEGETVDTRIISENEEPTIVTIEVELYEPLVPCRIEEDFSHLISEVLPKIEKKPQFVLTGDVAEAQYIHTIQKLAEALTESFRDFCETNKGRSSKDGRQEEKYCFDPESDEVTCFTQYLFKTGVYLSLRNALKMKIPMLIDQKFQLPENLVDSNESHNVIASVYTYLVEQMHVAINKMVEGRYTQNLLPEVDAKLSCFYAQEAYELGDTVAAKKHYTNTIALNKENSDTWVKYATFLKSIGDIERAKECCLEAIALDTRSSKALLVYAMILFENREYREAEIFLRALTNFYPRFFEGWAVLHIFYIRTDYYAGIDLTYRIAKKCMHDKNSIIIDDQEPLSWTTIHCPRDNLYMRVATILLKLKFCVCAEIALAQEMATANRAIHVLYYMAVEHYLSGRYEDALSHLDEVKCSYGMDFSISSLMGHCLFKMGSVEKAVKCYEFARMLFDRPDNLHLVEVRCSPYNTVLLSPIYPIQSGTLITDYSRKDQIVYYNKKLGYHYYNTGDFERARSIFLNVCNTSPTSLTWLGVGISCYELSLFREAELSLLEANRIDNYNPDIWGYLCLLNMTLKRYDEFSQCYSEMIKNNLKNRKLWLRITNLMDALDYAPPNLTESDDLTDDYSTEEFQERFEN